MTDKLITTSERIPQADELYRLMMEKVSRSVRVAMPGIITAFNPATQTVTVQPAIREKVYNGGKKSDETLPILVHVPILCPRAGGYALTMPVKAGDEVLVIFGDTCMDAWWQSGGVQNQIETRRHDLSDGYAILGLSSQPRVTGNYSSDAFQLRNDDGDTVIEIKGQNITIVAADTVSVTGANNVTVETKNATITASEGVAITAATQCLIESVKVALSGAWDGLRALIDERLIEKFNTHTHTWTLLNPVPTSAPNEPLVAADCTTEKVKGL